MVYNCFVDKFNRIKWKAWINEKYLDYRGNAIGNDHSITQYAEEYLGIPEQVVSAWLIKGSEPRKYAYVSALIRKYGLEVFEAMGAEPMGIVPPDYLVDYLLDLEEFTLKWVGDRGIEVEKL